MTRGIVIILVGFVLCSTTGCALYSQSAIPGRQITIASPEFEKYENLGHERVRTHGFRLLTIPITRPSAIDAVNVMLARRNADAVTDVKILFDEFNLTVFGITRITVDADVLKKKQAP